MRYFFESKVEKKDVGYTIQIPFNVWEVCHQREVIKGDIVLDNNIIQCELHPKEKGNYEIVITDEAAVKVELGVPHKILLHINGSLIRMDQNSPYSFENPIRKIDSMNVIIQPEDGLCGQNVETGAFRMGGEYYHLCPDCEMKMRSDIAMNAQQTAQKKENIVGGIVGALLGSLLGMLSVLILSQLGYVAALSGVIMAVCVLKGYEMLGGKLTKKAVVISAVIMILMTYFADRVDWAIILFNQGGGAEAGYSLFECYRLIPAALSAEIIDMGSYIGNLVLQYLFVALGAIPTVIGKMKQKKEEGIIARLN